MAERLQFDILANADNAVSGFVKAGRSAAAASDDVLGLAKRLDEISKKSATARVELAGNKEAMAQLDKLDLKLLATGRSVTDAKVSVDGVLKAATEIQGLDLELDKLGAKSETASASVGSSGLSGVSGLGALIGAGVVLSPIIATLATGLAGFGLAAYGAAAPIMKAAQATGGLAANMHTLNPEQQDLAKSILALGKQYDGFQKALQPEVLHVFGKGIQLAGDLMHQMEPVAKATGIALGGLLGSIDAEFKSGTWTKFFGFMATTAAPDMKLLGTAFTTLMDALPGLLEALQPVATGLLNITIDGLKVVDMISKLPGTLDKASASAKKTGGAAGGVEQGLIGIGKVLVDPAFGLSKLIPFFEGPNGLKNAMNRSADGVHKFGDSAATAAPKTQTLAQQVTALTTAMQANIGETLTLQGDTLGLKQAQQAALTQMRSNTAGLDGNSKNALANQAAVLAASQAAQTLANEQLTKLHPNLKLASQDLQDQINWLQKHGEHSHFAMLEIRAFRLEEAKIKAQIKSDITVDGTGRWNVTQGPGGTRVGTGHNVTPRAAGWRVPGYGGGDRWPALLEGGEAVVPKHLTPAVAPLLKAHGVPGFAAGGVMGSYSGNVAGLAPWLSKENSATLLAIETAVAAAVKTGIAAAASGGFGGIGPGGGGPNLAIGQRMAASIGWTGANWAFLRSGWMEESGWNQHAQNRSGGGTPYTAAYGIPQSNPGSKMAAAGPNWLNDPATQIRWGLGYIRSTYGSPTGVPHWSASGPTPGYVGYDSGVQYLPPGLSLAMNNTGRPERVGGEDLAPLLRELIRAVHGSSAATGHAMAQGLQGTARRAGARGMYSARGAWA